MPKLSVSIYRDMARDSNNLSTHAPKTPALTEFTLDIKSEPTVSEPFPKNSHFAIIYAEADCAIQFGPNPEASPERGRIGAGERLSFGIDVHDCISVIEVV
jgi:hypothetical protein